MNRLRRNRCQGKSMLTHTMRGPSTTWLIWVAALLAVVATGCGAREESGTADSTRAATSVDTLAAARVLGSGAVYTANEGGASISRIELETGRVTTFGIGLLAHNVQISDDGQSVFAVGSPPGAMRGMSTGASTPSPANVVEPVGALLVFVAEATDTMEAIRIPIGREPAHVISAAQRGRAYTTNAEENAVFEVDISQRRVTDTILTGASPHGLRASPNGEELYVAVTGDNAVSVINVAQGREVKRLSVGRAPVQVAFLPDGARVYVTLRDDNAVAVLDTRTRRVLSTIAVGRSPIQLFATPDGRQVYVANQGTAEQPDSTVSVIDTQQDKVVRTIIAGRGAHGVVISPDGRRVFIANTFAGTVSVIDAVALRVIGTVSVGAGPGGITYRPPRP